MTVTAHDDGGTATITVVAGPDSSRGAERDGMVEVHGLAFGFLLVGVDEHDFFVQYAALEAYAAKCAAK